MAFFSHNTNSPDPKLSFSGGGDTAISETAAMDAEIRLVARFHSLTLWRVIASAALISFELMRAVNHLRTTSAFYILCVLNLLPALLEPLCAPHVHKSTPVLPFLRRRYRYSSVRYTAMELTFLITGAFLALWQSHNHTPAYQAAWLYHFPVLLLGFSFLWRVVSPALISRHIRKKMGAV